jgi:hypothetical protein
LTVSLLGSIIMVESDRLLLHGNLASLYVWV